MPLGFPQSPHQTAGALPFLIAANFVAVISSVTALEVAFSEPRYTTTPGREIELLIKLRYEEGEEPNLFSFGVRVLPNPGTNLEVGDILVVPALDHSGFAQGALTSSEKIGAKGNVALSGGKPPPYTGTELMRVRLTPARAGRIQLGLNFYRTTGPNEDVFVDSAGGVLDSQIHFIGSTLDVLPTPIMEISNVPNEPRVTLRYGVVPRLRSTVFHSRDLVTWRAVSSALGEGSVEFFWDTDDDPSGFFRLETSPTSTE